MADQNEINFSRRERQVMNILYEVGEASAQDVLERLPKPPSYSAVRSLLSKLEQKGHIEHWIDGPRYMYRTTKAREDASSSALKNMMTTFFEGSALKTVNALFQMNTFTDEELENLEQAIAKAREEGN